MKALRCTGVVGRKYGSRMSSANLNAGRFRNAPHSREKHAATTGKLVDGVTRRRESTETQVCVILHLEM